MGQFAANPRTAADGRQAGVARPVQAESAGLSTALRLPESSTVLCDLQKSGVQLTAGEMKVLVQLGDPEQRGVVLLLRPSMGVDRVGGCAGGQWQAAKGNGKEAIGGRAARHGPLHTRAKAAVSE